jgi:hypothetical protein
LCWNPTGSQLHQRLACRGQLSAGFGQVGSRHLGFSALGRVIATRHQDCIKPCNEDNGTTAENSLIRWQRCDMIPMATVHHGEDSVMARKRQTKGTPDMSTAEVKGRTLRAVRLELPPDMHALLRLEAARQDRSLGDIARIAVEDYLRQRSPKGK